METVAKLLSPMILEAVGVPAHARRMLDVGGSHGLHTAAFYAQNPGLEAEIVDFAESLTTTRRLLEERGLSDRVTLRAADATRASFNDTYDVILLLSVLHNQTLAGGEQLVHRLARVLRPNGVFVVHEHFRGPIPRMFPSAFDLTRLVETGTATVTEASVEGWLVAAGLMITKRVDLPGDGMGAADSTAPGLRAPSGGA